MGLDFRIERRRKGKNYENLEWEECFYGRNCWNVRTIFLQTIEVDDDGCGGDYPISLGAMQIIIQKLSDRLQHVDLRKLDDIDSYNVSKLLLAIKGLSNVINEALWDYESGIEYEYRVFDSY